MARSTTGFNLTADTAYMVMCVQITDRLGNVEGYTEHDNPLAINIGDGNGEITYSPDAAFGRTAIEARSGGRVGSVDLIGFIDSAGITEEKILGGLYDSAFVRMFLVDWTAPAGGIIWIDIGELEETQLQDDRLVVTFKSLLDRYNTTKIGEYYKPDCFHVLGSQPTDIPRPWGRIGCRVQINAPEWVANTPVNAREDRNGRPAALGDSPTILNTVKPTTENGRLFEATVGGTTGGSEPSWNTTLGGTTSDGSATWIARQAWEETVTIQSVVSQREFLVNYSGDAPEEWYQRGLMTFTSGANVGISKHIKSMVYEESPNTDVLRITTWLPFPLGVEAGSPEDAATLLVGCDKKLITCKDKFRNLQNFPGFAVYAPNMDEVFKIPKQTGT